FTPPATTGAYTLSLHDALPILAPDELRGVRVLAMNVKRLGPDNANPMAYRARLANWEKQLTSHGAREFKIVLEPEKLADLLDERSEEHTSELQSRGHLVCRLLL